QQPVLARVVHLGALTAHGEAPVAEVVEYRPGPGDRAPGDDDVGGTRRGGGGECVPGALRHRVVVTQQRAVEVGGDEPVREGRCDTEWAARGSVPSRSVATSRYGKGDAAVLTWRPAPAVHGRPGRGAAPRARAPTRRPAGGSPGSPRWCAVRRTGCR